MQKYNKKQHGLPNLEKSYIASILSAAFTAVWIACSEMVAKNCCLSLSGF